MKLIILPGNDKSNKEWLHEADDAFSGGFDRYTQEYSHWDSGKDIIDFDVELEKLTKSIGDEKDYIILAKSAGAMLAIYGVFMEKIKPTKCIFIGLPINWAEKNKFPLRVWLEKFNASTLIIQNSKDPVTSFGELQNELSKINKDNIRSIEINGDDHKYFNFDLIKKEAGIREGSERSGIASCGVDMGSHSFK